MPADLAAVTTIVNPDGTRTHTTFDPSSPTAELGEPVINAQTITVVQPDGTRTLHNPAGDRWSLAKLESLLDDYASPVRGLDNQCLLIVGQHATAPHKGHALNPLASALRGKPIYGTAIVTPYVDKFGAYLGEFGAGEAKATIRLVEYTTSTDVYRLWAAASRVTGHTPRVTGHTPRIPGLMSLTLTKIAEDGTRTLHNPKNGTAWTLEELQQLVGGYIETLPVLSMSPPTSSGITAIFDEEGRIRKDRKLARNPIASILVGRTLIGPVLIAPSCVLGERRGSIAQAEAVIETIDAAEVRNAEVLGTFYLDVFITAMEGGIANWATTLAYRHSITDKDGDLIPDRVGFRAVVSDEDEPTRRRVIDRDIIERGFAGLRDELEGDDPDRVTRILNALDDRDAGELDADDADLIVQIGLFGALVYG